MTNSMSKAILTAGIALAGALAASTANAEMIDRVKVGVLDCVVEGGSGYVIGSTKDVRCTYKAAGDDQPETEPYFGVIKKFGIDVGSTDATYMTWAVFAPTGDPFDPGALAGNYFGVSAEATAGAGIGANALVGGSGKTIALQPISLQSQTGLNFAVTISQLELRSAAN